MAQIAKADLSKDTTDSVAEDEARGGFQIIQKTVDAVGKGQRAAAHRSAEGTAELAQALVDLGRDQTWHNLETLTALSSAVDWGRIFQIQGEFLRGSVERVAQVTQRYFEVSHVVIASAVDTVEDRVRKAA